MTTRFPSSRLTYQDLLALPDDLFRHELIDGEHIVSPAPSVKHQRVVVRLTVLLETFIDARQLGTLLVGPADVLFSQHDVVEPDLLFVAAARGEQVRERYIAGAPDLVVEVLSPSNRGLDKIRKRRLYETQGVPEYWIVDPLAATIEVYRQVSPHLGEPGEPSDPGDVGGRFGLAATLSLAKDATLETPLLPGLLIPLRDVFR